MTLISNFRSSIATDAAQKGGKKGGGGNWREEMRLPKDPEPPAAMVFIDAKYQDLDPSAAEKEIAGVDAVGQAKPVMKLYKKVRQHMRKYFVNGKDRFADSVCSKGYDPYHPQPCIGCTAADTGDKNIKLSDKFAFGFFHLAYYHGHPVVKDDGTLLMRKDGNEPILNYDACVGRDCNYCRILRGQPAFVANGQRPFPNYNPAHITTTFGRRRYLILGKNHLTALAGWDSAISANCGTCRAPLQTEGFACPTCDSLLVDMSTDPRTTAQITDAVSRPIPCQTCKANVMVTESTFCPSCESKGTQWVRNTLTDVVAMGCRQGESTASTLMLKGFQTIEEFESMMISQNPDFRKILGDKTLRQYINEHATPYDFETVLGPQPLEAQVKRLGYDPGSFGTGGGQSAGGPGFSNYGPQGGAPNSFQPSWAGGQQQGAQGPAAFVPAGRPNFGK